MKEAITEYYGDSVRWFFGLVIDSNPPAGLEGRVKIRIRGIHNTNTNDIPQVDLPWAQIMMPGDSFGVSGLGPVPQLSSGATVFGIFLDGKHSQLPLILGTVPKQEFPTTIQSQNRKDLTVDAFSFNYSTNIKNLDSYDLSVPETRIELSLKFFIDNGYTLEQSCGVVSVLFVSSELNPDFSNGNFRGISGWDLLSRRWTRMTNFAGRFEEPELTNKFDLQLAYVLHELRTTQRIANGKLLSAKTIECKLTSGRRGRGNGSVAVFFNYYLPGLIKQTVKLDDAKSIAADIYDKSLWSIL